MRLVKSSIQKKVCNSLVRARFITGDFCVFDFIETISTHFAPNTMRDGDLEYAVTPESRLPLEILSFYQPISRV